ncbi:peptidoglycan-binding protein [Luteipulveratus flavus]|uniref:Peptidoglycan-binding protein n=1 Tax=Luteipulveratus flavus TaxID=3031728 RepID=A0ABT6C2Y5_9MICO|nr:peptidoglycan-binding protein [Luteipulveratus sp. YIM 133296]MDF8263212.1 peptidoglycan-binding protein [Luteipulveratus sp. YIM 133296]
MVAAVSVAAGGGVVALLRAEPAQAAVRFCSSITPVSQRPTLRAGDTGWCVQNLQSRLNSRGAALTVDHDFGSKTLAAVKAFQRSAGLQVDGVVGAKTWTALIGGTLEIPAYTTTSGYIQQRGPNRTSRIVLTFDDCPSSYTSFKAMVDAAQAQRVTLVLAPTGDCQAGSRFSAAYARAHGQVVIGHSKTHPNLVTLTDAQVVAQIDPGSAASGYMRPPYGSWNARVSTALGTRGVKVWAWTRDTGDWTGLSQAQVVSYVTSTARANDTILMHMQWKGFSPSALGQIKTGLAGRGLALCQAYVGTTAPTALPAQLPC